MVSPGTIVMAGAALGVIGAAVVLVVLPRIAEIARAPEVVETLTFADVIRYFTNQRPNDPRVSAGALLRSSHPRGQLIDQVFLDERDKVCANAAGVPYGRRLVASRLDPELAAKFADLDVVIFR